MILPHELAPEPTPPFSPSTTHTNKPPTAHRGDKLVLAVVYVNCNVRSCRIALPKSVSKGSPSSDNRTLACNECWINYNGCKESSNSRLWGLHAPVYPFISSSTTSWLIWTKMLTTPHKCKYAKPSATCVHYPHIVSSSKKYEFTSSPTAVDSCQGFPQDSYSAIRESPKEKPSRFGHGTLPCRATLRHVDVHIWTMYGFRVLHAT